jgi:RNA polymerase sigma-70 factor (ECF subfamily)
MEQIKSGDADAFDRLYQRYQARAYRLARSVCLDHGRAEDAVQEAFIVVWRNRDAYQPERGALGPWLLSVVHYRAIDALRRDARHTEHRASEAMIRSSRSFCDDIAEGVIARADAALLRAPLRQLPDAQLEVITLAYYGQLTHGEIAAQLGLSSGTVKGRMRLGLQKLRSEIQPLAA